MTDARARRHKALADILRGSPVASQEEVTERLRANGYQVTQATVSRDLDQLGAMKVKRGGVMSYALPDQIASSDFSASRLQRILSEWVLGLEAAGNLIVFKTPPGSAHLVASAIDGSDLPEVAGTVSGDDTLFVAVRDGVIVGAVLNQFRQLSGKQ